MLKKEKEVNMREVDVIGLACPIPVVRVCTRAEGNGQLQGGSVIGESGQ